MQKLVNCFEAKKCIVASGREFCEGALGGDGWPSGELRGGSPGPGDEKQPWNLESVIQSEVSQKEKNKHRMLTHIYGI